MIISLKKLSKSRASTKIIVILIEIQLFDVVDLNDEESTSDYHMRFKAKQTKNNQMRETHQLRMFVVVKRHHELDNDDNFNCFRHVTRETRLQQMKNLQHIILNDQPDSNAENDDDEIILVTNLESSVNIQRIDRVNHLTKMCKQAILTLNVDQDDWIFQKLILKIVLSEMQSLLKMRFKNEQIFLDNHVRRKERDIILTYAIFQFQV